MPRSKKRLVSEINVVPYIDVMLVLLIVFMVAAPLLIQGVDVNLPETNAKPITNPNNEEPLIVSMKLDKTLYLNIGSDPKSALSLDFIKDRVKRIARQNPDLPILVWGDKKLPYGDIMQLMSALQDAGARSVGLVSEPPNTL